MRRLVPDLPRRWNGRCEAVGSLSCGRRWFGLRAARCRLRRPAPTLRPARRAKTHEPPQLEADRRLRELPEEAAKFWTDQAHRARVLSDWSEQFQSSHNPQLLPQYFDKVDRLVMAGLRALGAERPDFEGVLMGNENVTLGKAAGVRPSGHLYLNLDSIRSKIAEGAPDAVLLDLIHESLHGRARFAGERDADGKRDVEGPWPGYEEAAVETRMNSLARRAGIAPIGDQYAYWRDALETLADVLEVTPDRLATEMLTEPPGTVRSGFVKAVGTVRGAALSKLQAERLEAAANEVFQASRSTYATSEKAKSDLEKGWREALE